MCITNKIGPPVEGKDFFGREKELKYSSGLLERNHSLLLSAPRRIGKSSLAKRLIQEKKEQGWKCAYIDLEETATEEGFLRLVIDAFSQNDIWKRVTNEMSKKLTEIFGRVEKVSIGSVDFNLNTTDKREKLYQNLKELIKHDEDTFIVVDELSLFLGLLYNSVGGCEKTVFILNWLRSLRQVSRTKVRWLFCGSVGLRNFTSSLNLGYAINDLTEFSLDEMDRNEAAGLLLGLCNSENVKMSDELVNYTLDKLYWNIPYFIQVIFSKLLGNYNGEISKYSIDTAYNELCSENYLGTWSERLTEYRDFEVPARRILKALSTRPMGMERNALLDILMTGNNVARVEELDYVLSKVLEMLENDGYIMKKGTIRTFRSPLLRDYWFDRFVQ